jgi:hypothetical protein
MLLASLKPLYYYNETYIDYSFFEFRDDQPVSTQHMLDEQERLCYRRRTKEYPGKEDDHKCSQHVHTFPSRGQVACCHDRISMLSVSILQHEGYIVQAMQQSPHQERPICTVPEAADRKGHQDIANSALGVCAASPKWDIEVVAEPRRKRNMPPTPEFSDIAREVWISKIL